MNVQNKDKYWIVTLLLLLGVAIFLLFTSMREPLSSSDVLLENTLGEVQVIEPGVVQRAPQTLFWKAVKDSQKVVEGHRIRTIQGQAIVSLDQGTILTLQPETMIVIRQNSKEEPLVISVEWGKLSARTGAYPIEIISSQEIHKIFPHESYDEGDSRSQLLLSLDLIEEPSSIVSETKPRQQKNEKRLHQMTQKKTKQKKQIFSNPPVFKSRSVSSQQNLNRKNNFSSSTEKKQNTIFESQSKTLSIQPEQLANFEEKIETVINKKTHKKKFLLKPYQDLEVFVGGEYASTQTQNLNSQQVKVQGFSYPAIGFAWEKSVGERAGVRVSAQTAYQKFVLSSGPLLGVQDDLKVWQYHLRVDYFFSLNSRLNYLLGLQGEKYSLPYFVSGNRVDTVNEEILGLVLGVRLISRYWRVEPTVLAFSVFPGWGLETRLKIKALVWSASWGQAFVQAVPSYRWLNQESSSYAHQLRVILGGGIIF